MNGTAKSVFDFGNFRLIPNERLLLRNGEPVQLPPKAFDILAILVQNAGDLVEKDELLRMVWKDSFVEEANIQVYISAIRKAIQDKNNGKFIETVPTRGYRFTGVVTKQIILDSIFDEREPNGVDRPIGGPGPDKGPQEAGIRQRTFLKALAGNKVALAVCALLLLGLVGIVAYNVVSGSSVISPITNLFRPAKTFSFASIQVKQITDSGGAFNADISSDGKYIAYESVVSDKYAVWLMDAATNSSVQVTTPSEVRHGGITFSPDGGHLYFTVADDPAISTLYRIPKLGGEPEKILDQVDSPVSFSPNGSRFAFLRKSPSDGAVLLRDATSDGKVDRTIAASISPVKFSLGKRPVWSPDGKTIACIGAIASEGFLRVFTVNVSDGAITPLTSEKWVALQDVIWMPDSDNLLITAQDDRNFGPLQIWSTSVSSGGVAKKQTHEIKNYVGLSLAPGADSLVTTLSEAFNNIWLVPQLDMAKAKQIVLNKGGGRVDMSWTPDGRIIYTSNSTGNPNIFVMNSNGGEQSQLTSDTFPKRSPVVSPDGRSIVFVSSQSGPEQIWRMDIDGTNQSRLTSSHTYRYPQVSNDSKWVVYTTWQDKTAHIWKVPIDGGEPLAIKENLPYTPNVSPDLRSVAYFEKEETAGTAKIHIASLPDGHITRSFDITQNMQPDMLRWTADSKSVMYAIPGGGTLNYWRQSINSAEPTQLTDFRQDIVRGCVFSRSETDLVCVRSSMVRDIVLIRGMFDTE